MIQTIHVEVDRAEGSLQRLIGLIERRGFEIDRVELTGAGTNRSVAFGLRARDPGRCVQILGRQIDRLVGVRRTGDPAEVGGAPWV